MDEMAYDGILLIDDVLEPGITVGEAEALKPIQKQFMESYVKNKDSMAVEDWLRMEMSESLPEYGREEVDAMCSEIITTLTIQEEKKISLTRAVESGRSKESWFASETENAVSFLEAQEAAGYLESLDAALTDANESLYRTIHTQAGAVSQNPNLDGFIAEQYHAQTFNLNAEAAGSQYRAKVLEPSGQGYAKNSVDIEIVDGNGKVVRRYQSKYCRDAEATAQAFEKGDYRGQQKLIPDQQVIAKKSTTVIEAPDGVKSSALTKGKAKELQSEAQSGNWNELNWNQYQARDLAIGIGKQAGQAALIGAAVGVGFDVAQKVWNGEEIDGAELVETAVASGADFGVKAAAAGALKVGAERGIIKAIPKGTPAGTLANVAFVAVENVKIIGKMVSGELTFREGVEKMEQTTVSTIAGIAASTKGAAVGAAVGTVFGPVGTVVGGLVGGTIGYMAGSTVGETVVKGAQKIREKTREFVRDVRETAENVVRDVAERISDGIGRFCDGVRSLFCW